MRLVLLFFIPVNLGQILVTGRCKHDYESSYLHKSSWMLVEYDADYHSKNLTSGDYKRNNVLLELLYHSVNKNLTYCCQTWQQKYVSYEWRVLVREFIWALKLTCYQGVAPAQYCYPLVNMHKHLHRSGLILWLNNCLEIW